MARQGEHLKIQERLQQQLHLANMCLDAKEACLLTKQPNIEDHRLPSPLISP